MRSNLITRVFVGAAVVLLSVFLAAPAAHAETPDAGGNSAEHRNDADAQSQRDERRTGEPEQAAGTTSDPAAPLDEPQPASNADFSGNGANDHGAYDSTRDESASENGNGDGAAIGKPCAGCVGKADNKNPRGQFPDGSDANNGYECDGNSGIGKTNPAHTGCTPARPPTPPSVQATGSEVLGLVFTLEPASVLP